MAQSKTTLTYLALTYSKTKQTPHYFTGKNPSCRPFPGVYSRTPSESSNPLTARCHGNGSASRSSPGLLARVPRLLLCSWVQNPGPHHTPSPSLRTQGDSPCLISLLITKGSRQRREALESSLEMHSVLRAVALLCGPGWRVLHSACMTIALQRGGCCWASPHWGDSWGTPAAPPHSVMIFKALFPVLGPKGPKPASVLSPLAASVPTMR